MEKVQEVVFKNKDLDLRLAGILRLPDNFDLSKNYPAIVVTGPMLSVKEQVQSIYASRLTKLGYVTLVFDGSYFGESEGTPRLKAITAIVPAIADISKSVMASFFLPGDEVKKDQEAYENGTGDFSYS